MRIWQKPISDELLTAGTQGREPMGIEFVEVGDDYIEEFANAQDQLDLWTRERTILQRPKTTQV